jgi:hypothetical protein
MRIALFILIWLLCTSFTFKWSPHPKSDDDFYMVEYKPAHGGWRDWMRVNKVEGRKIYDVWIEPLTRFDCARVRAINTVGQSEPSKRNCEGEE